MNLSRRSFFKQSGAAVAAASVALNTNLQVVESVVSAPAPAVLQEAIASIAVPEALPMGGLSFDKLEWVLRTGEYEDWNGSKVVLADVKKFADSVGLSLEELGSRISTYADHIYRPAYSQDIFGLNMHNSNDYDLLINEHWGKTVDHLSKMGYNVEYRSMYSPVYKCEDHLSVPRDPAYYKQCREEFYELSYEGNPEEYPEHIKELLRSDVFFDDEQVIRTGTRTRYNEDTCEYEEVFGAVVLLKDVPTYTLVVREVYGPEFGFVLLKPEFRF